ncbi:hypothetical protein C8J57DRAFT_1309043 [Mycena rebaudengoi]|nr:hypothetical protein C8J57DRAFT_1309043 [Mycena rebaudengoi]
MPSPLISFLVSLSLSLIFTLMRTHIWSTYSCPRLESQHFNLSASSTPEADILEMISVGRFKIEDSELASALRSAMWS